jgi:hypothetical protein
MGGGQGWAEIYCIVLGFWSILVYEEVHERGVEDVLCKGGGVAPGGF